MQHYFNQRASMYQHVTTVKNRSSITRYLCLCIVALIANWPLNSVVADNTILLSIHGNIESAAKEAIGLNLEKLTSLEATTLVTDAPWTDGPTQYTGVRINTLLESIGANSSQFEAIAANEYRFMLTDIDFEKYPVLIAYKKNGELLDIRSLGPLMIVFPFDDFPELLTERNKAASVWQLIEMEIL